MNPTTPTLTSPETIQKRSGYQSMQSVTRPSYWGVRPHSEATLTISKTLPS